MGSPSDVLNKEYLSWSKVSNIISDTSVISVSATVNEVPDETLETCLVIFNVESVKSTLDTSEFGKGVNSAPEPLIIGAPKNIGTDIVLPWTIFSS